VGNGGKKVWSSGFRDQRKICFKVPRSTSNVKFLINEKQEADY
jgi:hypothetical protein